MVVEQNRYVNSDNFISGQYLIAYELRSLLKNEGLDAATSAIQRKFHNIVISHDFVVANPHVLFEPYIFNETRYPILSIDHAYKVVDSSDIKPKGKAAEKSMQLTILRALVNNLELYQLVEDAQGILLRWGRSESEEETTIPTYNQKEEIPILGLSSHLKEFISGRFVTWWSRLNVRDRRHFRGGTVLRETSLDKVKKSHYLAKDLHENFALVLIKR
jgi:hypothetical protein